MLTVREHFTVDAQGTAEEVRTTFYPRPLVGIIGRKRAGKDTFAGRLVEAYGYRRFAFADALKEAALELDPIVTPLDTVQSSHRLSEVVELIGWEGAKEYAEVRRTLQRYGAAIRRIDPDFWLRRVLAQAEANPAPVVITDVRYPNEAKAIRDRGGYLVRVFRPGQDDSDMHESETALDGYPADRLVLNNGTVDELLAKADAVASRLRG
ncbi:hypothetical protein [Micromonospora sp. NPDC047730]|uniref:deoxynucleotide monophosphate kinase family protein n=1 Tax=Micromonospora sp. NPDC047730 TaxID=3364253 RepID=UPI0037182C41